MLRLVSELRPGNVFVENVAGAAWKQWVPVVREALHGLGYSSLSVQVSAEEVGAPFKGARVFVAATDRHSESAFPLNAEMEVMPEPSGARRRDWGKPEARDLGMADGLPETMDRLRALGNAVVPAQAREAFMRAFVQSTEDKQ
jgi:DNA (cytosine-5)-methyltransferase 1